MIQPNKLPNAEKQLILKLVSMEKSTTKITQNGEQKFKSKRGYVSSIMRIMDNFGGAR